jgi:hypothetical protein
VLKWETIAAVVTEHYIHYEFKPNGFFYNVLYIYLYIFILWHRKERELETNGSIIFIVPDIL